MLSLAVAVAAGLGAVGRFLADRFVQHRSRGRFPTGTAVVNVTGSLFLGLVAGWAVHAGLPTTPTVVLGTGFAGGYTTLSTWAWESLALAETGELMAAALNVVGSVALGLAAAAAGLGLAQL